MPPADRPMSIGVIDPDASSRRAVARLLLAHGHASTPFESIADYEAQGLAQGPTSLIFLDARLWLDAGAAVRKRVFCGGLVVVLAAEARIEQVGGAFAAGCFDFLVKPLAPELMLDIIAQAAGQAGGAAA